MPIRKRWAFLVGINRYNDYSSLTYCVDDVQELEKLLKAAGYTVVCLHDRLDREDNNGKPNPLFPTEKNIRGKLKYLCDMIQQGPNQGQDDLLLAYFACHGSRQPDDIPRLMAWDTQQSLVQEAISITEIEQRMEESGAGCRMLMLDACQIGLGTSDIGSRAPSNPALLRRIHETAKGYALLAASSDQQDAKEWGGMKHGVFSYYVLSGLSGEADLLGKNYVTVNDLAGYVSLRIQEWAVEHGVDQVPRQRVEDNLGGFILIPKGCFQEVTELNPIEPSADKETLSQGIQSRGRSPTQIIECLWSLNYVPQCRSFDDTFTSRSQRAAAFVVKAKDYRIQLWLVKRLANQIPNVANAKVFPFTVPSHRMWKQRDLNELWIDLARKLGCADNRRSVLDALVQVYRTKPVIIAMYKWSTGARSQTLQQQVLSELWNPLVEAIGELPTPPLRSRLILFLAEGSDPVANSAQSNSSQAKAVMPIRLDPLTAITSDHVDSWMVSDVVYPVLRQFVPEEQLKTLIDDEISKWSSDPVETIEQICYIFELENGIADIEAEWRLAG